MRGERVTGLWLEERELTNTHFLTTKLIVLDVNEFNLLRGVSFRSSFSLILPQKK